MSSLLKKIMVIAVVALSVAACSDSTSTDVISTSSKKPTKAATILIFGDSISQGYGTNNAGIVYQQVTPGKTYAELLRAKIVAENINQYAPVTVINAS